jgi:hypothetical protein
MIDEFSRFENPRKNLLFSKRHRLKEITTPIFPIAYNRRNDLAGFQG